MKKTQLLFAQNIEFKFQTLNSEKILKNDKNIPFDNLKIFFHI